MFPITYRIVVYFGHDIVLEFFATDSQVRTFREAMEKGKAINTPFSIIFGRELEKNEVVINPDFVQMYHMHRVSTEQLNSEDKKNILSTGLSFVMVG